MRPSRPLRIPLERACTWRFTSATPKCRARRSREVFGWLARCLGGRVAKEQDGLRKRLRGLYEKWDRLEGETRAWCEQEMKTVQTQLAALGGV